MNQSAILILDYDDSISAIIDKLTDALSKVGITVTDVSPVEDCVHSVILEIKATSCPQTSQD